MNVSLRSFIVIAIGVILLAIFFAFIFSVVVALLPVIIVIVGVLALMNYLARRRAEKVVQEFFEEAEKQAQPVNSEIDGDVIDVEAKEVSNK